MGFQWMINSSNCTINNSGNLFINGVRPYAFYRTIIFLSLTKNKKGNIYIFYFIKSISTR
jgi:hypothetical protein